MRTSTKPYSSAHGAKGGTPLCRVQSLSLGFRQDGGEMLWAAQDVSFEIEAGEALGIVGESGSGKTLTAMAILGLLPPNAIATGRVEIDGEDILTASPERLSWLRAHKLGLIMQDPTSSLHPVRTIGSQLRETARLSLPRDVDMRQEIARALEDVGLDAQTVERKYPFELSGGMNQRVALAMALIKRPSLLVADEPTTALDVTTQARILALLKELSESRDLSFLLISHDLGVVHSLVERIAVMYAGRVVEYGPITDVLQTPTHPYSFGLREATPRLGAGSSVRLPSIRGQLEPLVGDPVGCSFAPRCDRATSICRDVTPALVAGMATVASACHHPLEYGE